MPKIKYANRELSWLSFNYRVLQEAKNETVPLFERIKFLAIFSSNLDEFYRVRVAAIKSVLNMNGKSNTKLSSLLRKIYDEVDKQQNEYGTIIKEIFLELETHNIFLLNIKKVGKSQTEFIANYFNQNVRPLTQPTLISGKRLNIFLNNKIIYLAVKLSTIKKNNSQAAKKGRKIFKYAIVKIPSDTLPRFVELPEENEKRFVIFLDDILKLNLGSLFPGYKVEEFYSVKLTRDAELYIDDEFSGNLLEKIRKSLNKRNIGAPTRFLYDSKIPKDFLKILRKEFDLKKEDLIPGGEYHNLNDLFTFPTFNLEELLYKKQPSLSVPDFDTLNKMFDVIDKKDVFLHYPYHSYDYVIKFLNEASVDPEVKSIKITLYRTASNSKIIGALIDAAKMGKKVTVFVEVKARFDEEPNFINADKLKKAGIKILYSFPGLKVHAKICLISKLKEGNNKIYAYLSTGNFNEDTARLYSDFGLFTSNNEIVGELKKVFGFLSKKSEKPKFNNILVAPFNLRKEFNKKINREISFAKMGNPAKIILKLNSLEDKKIIRKLYEASNAGVEIIIIVRGICCLVPGIKELSENIKVISIVDRYLEHARIYYFLNGGSEEIYLSSADWMKRNLDRRVEIAFPITDKSVKETLRKILEFQMGDNVKARIINEAQDNQFVNSTTSIKIRSQIETYKYLAKENDAFTN
ncbi:MAG TPA: polyphosphate kinase 1 [Ignavibacteria bacterium]|nr:polyphosphate kinase 1 [Ignavibacteria bacterium]